MKHNILATLAYYDVLDMPLKAEEVLRYLIKVGPVVEFPITAKPRETDFRKFHYGAGEKHENEIDLKKVKKTLDKLILDGIVDTDLGYYYFKDKDYLVPLRLKKERISIQKWKIAKRAIKWLAYVPYVEAIFASGTLAMNNCDELSDLDVLVVAKHGRIWTTRFLVSGMMSLLRVRRKWSDKIAPDKICLNHYITDKSLQIPFENIYNAQTYVNLKPILIRDPKIISRFYNENIWIEKYIVDPVAPKTSNLKKVNNWAVRIGEIILNSWIGNWLEVKLKKYQIRRIIANPLTTNPNGHIVYSDEMLAFHPDSPEEEVVKKYESLLARLK